MLSPFRRRRAKSIRCHVQNQVYFVMNCKSWKRFGWVLSMVASILLATSWNQHAFAGKTAPPPPTPPPVNYALGLFTMPTDYAGGSMHVLEMNDYCEAVGRYYLPDNTQQPFYFHALSGNTVATNLNDISLDPNWQVPQGWYIFAALGINDLGDIVGALARLGEPNTRRGFVLELRPNPLDTTVTPRLHLIPENPAWSQTYARRINNAGDVLGLWDDVTAYHYRPALHGIAGDTNVNILPFACSGWDALMNSPTASHGTQVVAWSQSYNGWVRYTLGDANPVLLSVPSSGGVRGLSDAGTFCGETYARNKYRPYYHDGTVRYLTVAKNFGQDINSGNDVLTEGGGTTNKPILVHSTSGALDLSKIVVASTPALQNYWAGASANWSSMTERGVPGTDPSVAAFPAIVGSVTSSTSSPLFYSAYVLLPIPVPK